jgi:ADP-ribosyl-[dinitrogen reductase] hydrolase
VKNSILIQVLNQTLIRKKKLMIDKVQGCFLGLAVGDALGVPVEFRDRSYFRSRPVKEMLGYGTWNQPPGTWSDDSSLAFCLAESLLNGYDLNDVAKKFIDWRYDGYWGAHHKCFDIGGATRAAILLLKKGESPLFSGSIGEDSNGNGSLMRIAPAAFYFSNLNDDEFFQRIKEVSSITHAHFRSVFSCYVFCKFMIELSRQQDKILALQHVGKDIREFSINKQFNPVEINRFQRILDGSIAEANEDSIHGSGYVLHTLEAAIWCFMKTDNYSEAVLKAVNLGDDTDTTACVTGALAGLYYGDQAIPAAWISILARKSDILKLSEDFAEALKKQPLQGKP